MRVFSRGVRRYISAAESRSEQILVRSTCMTALIPLSISAGVTFLFSYFLYQQLAGHYFAWQIDAHNRSLSFIEHYVRFGNLWLDSIIFIVALLGFVIFLPCLWRMGIRWVVFAPIDGVIQVQYRYWAWQRESSVALEHVRICEGIYVSHFYKTAVSGSIDVLLVVGSNVFLMNYGMRLEDADALAQRLARKLGIAPNQIESVRMHNQLPFWLFN